MDQNTTTWVVKVETPTKSSAVQRVAFSFGYHWQKSSQTVYATEAKFLFFDPNSKNITWDNEISLSCKLVSEWDDIMDLFENPPVLEPKSLKVNDYLAVTKQKLPLVHFIYDSPNSGQKMRYILVTDKTADVLSGLDIDDKYQSKYFSLNKVIYNKIYFDGFETEP